MIARSAVVVLALAGCGARSGLDVPLDVPPPAPTDAAVCVPEWSACRVSVGPMLVSGSELGQAPDACWAGDWLLVIYDGSGGNPLVALDLAGHVLSHDETGGLQEPRIECHPQGGALAVVDSGLRWLGPDGRPIGSFEPVMLGFQLAGDPIAVPDGYVILSGTIAYSDPPPLYAARVGLEPTEAPTFEIIAMGGPRYAAQHATGDDGFGTIAISAARSLEPADLWDVRTLDGPRLLRSLSLGAAGAAFALGLAEHDGHAIALYVRYDGASPWRHYLQDLDTGHTRLVNETVGSASGHLERLGTDLVAALRTTPEGETLERVAVGAISLETDRALHDEISLSEPGRIAHSERIARTPRGLAVVWSEQSGDTDGNSAFLAILDCCP